MKFKNTSNYWTLKVILNSLIIVWRIFFGDLFFFSSPRCPNNMAKKTPLRLTLFYPSTSYVYSDVFVFAVFPPKKNLIKLSKFRNMFYQITIHTSGKILVKTRNDNRNGDAHQCRHDIQTDDCTLVLSNAPTIFVTTAQVLSQSVVYLLL